jgi:hypothetical protein
VAVKSIEPLYQIRKKPGGQENANDDEAQVVEIIESLDLGPLSICFTANQVLRKGIANHAGETAMMDTKIRDMPLLAIVRSHHWMQ